MSTSKLKARHFFARRGILSKWRADYEFRPGQLEMAEAVEAALSERRHLIVEAGTGTGKTFAYLIPAILAGKRIVVSTGTKSLQEQLFYKDIPFLQKHLDHPPAVSLMKGRSNYACRQKIYDADKEPVLQGLEEVNDFQIIKAWEAKTETGDRAEISNLPPGSAAWQKLDARSEACTGQKCANFDRCFLTQMMIRARESDVIIVNHHLFFADLAQRGEGVIPEYDAVIFDEAHEIESVAGQFFGVSVSSYVVGELRRDIQSLSRQKDFGSAGLDAILSMLEESAAAFFACFPQQEGRGGFTAQESFRNEHAREINDLMHSLELASADLELAKGALEEVGALVRRAKDIRDKLKFWLRADDQKFVYWMDRRGQGVFLEATPINVADVLRTELFSGESTVILTSATLAVAGGFDFVRNRLGIESPRTLVAASTFDYASQAMLYVPHHLPDPRNPDFFTGAVTEIIHLLEISEGRAFVLFTSNAQMRQFHDRISLKVDYPCLLQGTRPNLALLAEFKETPNSVLFATSSFWQGIDVPGESLSCVIIDRLPFSVPSDPVVDARVRAVRESGGNPFYDYQVPEAAITLKQGLGRLIRTRSDRGILAILDTRITRQRYGQIFFDSLPDYGFTVDRAEVERFFRNV